MEYITLIQPAIIAVATLTGLLLVARGAKRIVTHDADTDEKRTRWSYQRRTGLKGVLVAVAGFLVASALVVTPPGSRGVIYTAAGGVNTSERAEGFSFVLPVFQSSIQMNIQTQKLFVEAFSQSQDLQEITALVTVNYRVDPGQAAELYRDVGRSYENVVIRPATLQLVKQEVGLVKAADFAASREQLAADIATQLHRQVAEFGIVIQHVNIEDAVFQPAFIFAVQQKVIADEKAVEQRRLVAASIAQADQVRETAEGDAAAIERLARADAEAIAAVSAALGFTPQEYLDYLFRTQWNGQLPATLVGDLADLGLLLEIGD